MTIPQLMAAALAAAQPALPSVELNQAAEVQPDPPIAEVQTETAAPAPEAVPADPAPPEQASTVAEPAFDDIVISKANDPLEPINRISFGFSMAADKAIIRPAAMVYRAVLPKPARDGVRNALVNLNEPMVFLNDFLQVRPDRMVRTLGRFVINTLLGWGGLFDVAKRKPFNLNAHGNNYGSTLGYYGMKPGPYVYIPILGPTTLRDQANRLPDPIRILERLNGRPIDLGTAGVAIGVVDGLGQRERADDDLKALLEDAVDPYATFRESFLQNRQGEIDWLKSKDK